LLVDEGGDLSGHNRFTGLTPSERNGTEENEAHKTCWGHGPTLIGAGRLVWEIT
jgi:hypothetical protein